MCDPASLQILADAIVGVAFFAVMGLIVWGLIP